MNRNIYKSCNNVEIEVEMSETSGLKVLLMSVREDGRVNNIVHRLGSGLKERGSEIHTVRRVDNSLVFSDENGVAHNFDGFVHLIGSLGFDHYDVVALHGDGLTDYAATKLRTASENAARFYHMHDLHAHTQFMAESDKAWTTLDDYVALLDENGNRQIFMRQFKSKSMEQLFSIHFADNIVFHHTFMKDLFRLWYPGNTKGEEHEVVVPVGSEFQRYVDNPCFDGRTEEIRYELRGDAKTRIIMYAGRITKDSGVTQVARVFNQIAQDQIAEKHPVKLLLVGEEDDKYDYEGLYLVQEQVRPKLRGDIIPPVWLKSKEHLASYIAAANVLIVPQTREYASMIALDAMTVGTPVILTDYNGNHVEYVKPGLAYGAGRGDVPRMVKHVKYILSNPRKAAKNARHARRVVTERFSDDRMIDATLSAYRNAVEVKNARTD